MNKNEQKTSIAFSFGCSSIEFARLCLMRVAHVFIYYACSSTLRDARCAWNESSDDYSLSCLLASDPARIPNYYHIVQTKMFCYSTIESKIRVQSAKGQGEAYKAAKARSKASGHTMYIPN